MTTEAARPRRAARGPLLARRGRAAAVFLALAGAAFVLPACLGGGPEGLRANVVLVSIDSLSKARARLDDPGALPNLQALGARSVVFDRALSPSSWTLPAHGSLLTGLYPDRHGATDRRLRLAPDLPALALSLQKAGYETVAFTDRGFLDRQYGFDRGFERYDDWTAVADPGLAAVLPRGGDFSGTPGSDLFDRALAFLHQRRQSQRPFFLFLHTFGVHDYFHAHPWATEMLPPYRDPAAESSLECLVGARLCSRAQWQRLADLYAAEVARVDQGLGLLLQALEDTGLRRSTFFLFVSDHGEGFDLALRRLHHGGRLHRDLLEVPLLISGPGLKPRTVAEPVSLVDVPPTVLELVGAPVPLRLDGVSVAAAARGQGPPPRRTLYAMEHALWWQDGRRQEVPRPRRERIGIAAIADGWWLIQSPAGEELYDLAADPAQTTNRAGRAGPGAGRLAVLRIHARERGTVVPSLAVRGKDENLERQLRSLGYVR